MVRNLHYKPQIQLVRCIDLTRAYEWSRLSLKIILLKLLQVA